MMSNFKIVQAVRFLVILFWIAAVSLHAQNLTPKIIQSDYFMRRVATTTNLVDVGQQIPTLPQSQGVRVNEVYLDSAWKKSSITLYGSEKLVEGFLVRYDLRSNSIEFRIDRQTKVLDVRRVATLIWLDSLSNLPHYFVNGKEYYIDNVPMTTLIEVLTEGKVSLYKQYSYWIKKPDYVMALDVGSRDERIYKQDFYYFGTEKVLTQIPIKKKSFFLIFGDQAPDIKKFMHDNDLKVSRELDLLKIFDYYNSIL